MSSTSFHCCATRAAKGSLRADTTRRRLARAVGLTGRRYSAGFAIAVVIGNNLDHPPLRQARQMARLRRRMRFEHALRSMLGYLTNPNSLSNAAQADVIQRRNSPSLPAGLSTG